MEIERKFLVRRDNATSTFANGTKVGLSTGFKALATSSSVIAQGYMNVEGATVRIRLRDDKAYLTIKGPSLDGGISRYEFEREIPLEDAKEMLKLCRGGLVEKVRWLVPYKGHTFEVDEFHGDNEGLLFAEVELGSVDEPFEKPEWLGKEVTGDRHYYNKNLLREPYSTWKSTVQD